MTAVPLERQVGSTVAGKYRLIRVLGRGGMGVVYEAEHAMTRRRVAVKVLHAHHKGSSDAARRFINEAQAAGKVSHPNVVEVLDAGEDADGSLYLVLELLSGHDLSTHLIRHKRIEVAETVTIIAQVLQALIVAHRQGIIHRDIKPENIFLARSVTGDTQVKILDFGISKAIGPDESGLALSVTQTNTTVGTPHYMSPEQARGERNIDTRADLWAVGVVMYECLAGRVPFDGDTYNDQIVRVITEPHMPLSTFDVPLELSRIVDRSLEKDRNRRYLDAAAMLAEIRHFIERHREYASVPVHLLRAPPVLSAGLPGPQRNNPTIDASADLAFVEVPPPAPAAPPRPPPPPPNLAPPGPPPPAPAALARPPVAPPSAGAGGDLVSLFDAANEDAPTVVRSNPSPDETGPTQLPPLAGARGIGPAEGADADGSARARASRRRVLLIGGIVLGAVAAGAVAAVALHRSPAPSVVASPPPFVTVQFTGLPPGAQVRVHGDLVDPSGARLSRATAATAVEVQAPGFATERLTVVPDRDQTIPVTLHPETPLPLPSPAPGPSPAPSSTPPALTPTAGATAPAATASTPEPGAAPTTPQPAPGPATVPVGLHPGAGEASTTSAAPVGAPSRAPNTPVVAASPGSNPSTTPRQAAAPATRPAPAQGLLSIIAQPPCNVSLDGTLRGRTPVMRVPIAVGPHRVLCQMPTGALRSRAIAITPRHETVVRFEP